MSKTTETVGTMFVNGKDELCIIKSKSEWYLYVEILDSDGEHYKIDANNFDKYLGSGRYKLAPKGRLGAFLYV